MKIEDILRTKGSDVVTISEGETMLEAARKLVDHNIGGLVIVEGERLTGILTERDLLRLTAMYAGELGAILVGTVMTTAVITAKPGAELTEVMTLMSENKIRRLPVMDGDRLAGIITIGDVVNALHEMAQEEKVKLRQYIQGGG